MNSNIEQILLAQAAREAEEGPKLSDMVALGAGGGAVVGGLTGAGVRAVSQIPNKAINALAARQGLSPVGLPLGARLRPGARMAGGLVGMLVGGALGAAAQQSAQNGAGEAATLLAKIQAQGGMTQQDQVRLELALKDAYSQQGLLG